MAPESKDWQQLVLKHVSSAAKPLIVILGPTASGKTGFSLKVAEFLKKGQPLGFAPTFAEATAGRRGLRAEIVNADSRQLYKYLNIGTAKITEEEKRGILHHLLNVLEPNEPVTVSWYQEQARKVIDEIHGRRNIGVTEYRNNGNPDTPILPYSGIPILVGGSMLYIRSITDGLTLAPKVSSELRTKLEKEYDKDQGATLFKRLQELDPESAETIDPKNKRYLVRALEILESTGMPLSETKTITKSEYDLLMLGMDLPREELHKRIELRTKDLFKIGWIDEVMGLLKQGYTAKDPGLESTGYKEIIEFLEGNIPSKAELLEKIIAKTRQYARRQMTWWRRDTRIQWINALTYSLENKKQDTRYKKQKV